VKLFFSDIAERYANNIPPADLATLRERMEDSAPETA
jgi:hypothetical protein